MKMEVIRPGSYGILLAYFGILSVLIFPIISFSSYCACLKITIHFFVWVLLVFLILIWETTNNFIISFNNKYVIKEKSGD